MSENINNKSKYKYNFRDDAKSFIDDLYTIEDVKTAIYNVILNRNKEDLIKERIEKNLKKCKFGENIITRDTDSNETWDLKYMLFFNIETSYVHLNLKDIKEDLGEYIKRNKIVKIEVFVFFRFNETIDDVVNRFYDEYLKCVGNYLKLLFTKFNFLKILDNEKKNKWEYNNYKFVDVKDNGDGNMEDKDGMDDVNNRVVESNGE